VGRLKPLKARVLEDTLKCKGARKGTLLKPAEVARDADATRYRRCSNPGMKSAVIEGINEANGRNSVQRSAANVVVAGHRPKARDFGSWAFALLTVLITLVLAGCSTTGLRSSTVTLNATGEPGLTFRVMSDVGQGIDRVVTVPAKLDFTGRNFDVRCVHGPQAGTLALSVVRDGLNLSTGNTTHPGQVTRFKIREGSVSATVESVTKSTGP
jgi:hypothetical protein